LYKYLTGHPNKDVAGKIEWNFQKYLVGRDGTVLAKYAPRTLPEDGKIVGDIEKALAAKAP
jgi:glutathione peroxidase